METKEQIETFLKENKGFKISCINLHGYTTIDLELVEYKGIKLENFYSSIVLDNSSPDLRSIYSELEALKAKIINRAISNEYGFFP